jgi:hypothetical protein
MEDLSRLARLSLVVMDRSIRLLTSCFSYIGDWGDMGK